MFVSEAKQVLGEIQSGAEEPARAEIRVRRRDAVSADEHPIPRLPAPARTLRCDDTAESPDGGPEGFRLLDRPAVKRRVVAHLGGASAGDAHVRDETREIRAGD